MDALIDFGYAGLFVAAFLAATVLPLSSEIVLSGLLLTELDPMVLVFVATFGNTLGACTNYALGYYVGKPAAHKFLRMDDKEFAAAEQRFGRLGLWALLLAWVPIIGDPITVIAGILRVRFRYFLILVLTGKLIRYISISFIITGSMN